MAQPRTFSFPAPLWRFLDARLSALHKLLALAIALAAPLTLVGWFSWTQADRDIVHVRHQVEAVDLVDSVWRVAVDLSDPHPDGAAKLRFAADSARYRELASETGDELGVGAHARAFGRSLAGRPPVSALPAVLSDGAYLVAETATAEALGTSSDGALSWAVWTTCFRGPQLLMAMDQAYVAAMTAPVTGPTMDTWRGLASLDNAEQVSLVSARRALALEAASGHSARMQDVDALERAISGMRAAFLARAAAHAPPRTTADAALSQRAGVHAADVVAKLMIAQMRAHLLLRESVLSAQRRGTAALSLVVLSIAGLCAAALAKSIMTPQRRLGAVMTQIAKGQTDLDPPYQDYRNEIGEMARAVEVFREAMIARDDLEASLERERKALEERVTARTHELERANAAKTDFVALLSHEIRTPLNGVLGMAAALARTDLQTHQREMLRVITASGDVLLHLLNNSIDIARIEAGELEMDIEPFDLFEMVDVAASLYRESALAKGLQFDVQVGAEAAGAYRGDVVRLRQILQNYVSNAVKFTERGTISVNVRCLGSEGGRTRLRFEVADTGVGLPPDTDRLFRRYGQVHSSRRLDGAGLGLAICRELAALMGGLVSAHPRDGGGAVFALEIALNRFDAAPAPAPVQQRPLAGARILVAEDNAMNRLVFKRLLEQAHVAIEMVEDGVQAVAAARGRAFDVIIMDVHMPGLDGLTASRMIRTLEGPNQHTPILALTADAMPAHIRACKDAGMTGHIAKPLKVDTLFTALADALATAPQSERARAAAG